MTATTVQYEVSLIPWQSPVVVQPGNLGDCGPCCTANAISLITNLDGQPFTVNPLTEYASLGASGLSGVNFEQMMSQLQTVGVTGYADSSLHTINTYGELIPTSPQQFPAESTLAHQIAQELVQGKPLFMSFELTNGIEAEDGPLTGPLSSLQSGLDSGGILGGHIAEIVACNTNTNMLTIATWGPAGGDDGYYNFSLNNCYGSQPILAQIAYVNGFNGIDLTQNAATAEVSAAFVGILNRAPALAGMQSYVAAINSGASLTTICNQIFASTEAIADVGANATNNQIVQYLFNNILGRPALQSGLTFYANELASGETRGQVAAQLITVALDATDWSNGVWSGTSAAAASDANLYAESLLFNNKVQAGEDYAITLQAGSSYTAVAHNYIASITTDTGSIIANLVGIPEQIGHAHIAPPTGTWGAVVAP